MGMASSSSIFHKTESCEKKWGKFTSIFTKFGQEFLHLLKLLYPTLKSIIYVRAVMRVTQCFIFVYDPTSTSSPTKEGRSVVKF